MAYIGVSPSNGVRRVHTYTATASQTTFSGAGAEGTSLSYKDSNFVDVYQNGVKLGDADYTATSGTSIVLGTGATASDLVVIVVFDVFSVADTVSKADGGTFDGNVTMGGTLTVSGAFTSLGIDDNADATAVTIDSNENVCIGVTSKNSSNNGSLTIGHTGMTKVSASASGNADELVIVGEDGSANAGMSIISNNANQGSIFFGDEDDTDIGKIVYDHSEDSMKMFTGTVEIVKLSSGATVFNNGGANMDFRVEGDTQAELFFIDAGSDFVGIGHSNYYSGKLSIFFDADSDNERGITLTPQNNTCTYLHFHNSGASTVGSITGNGSNTAFNTSSDYRLKENIEYDWDATTRLKQLKPARFNWIADDTNTTQDGFIAHEVSNIIPEAITGKKDAMTKEVLYVDGDDDIPEGKKVGDVRQASQIDPQGIDQSKLVPLLTKSLQEALTRIDALEAEVKALKGE